MVRHGAGSSRRYSRLFGAAVNYAARLLERIINRAKVLETLPLIGGPAHRIDQAGVQELSEASYRILYQVDGDRVDILAIVHAARDISRPGS